MPSHDPYSPPPARPRQAPTLPADRLRNLGATDRLTAGLAAWWARMSGVQRAEAAAQMADLDDQSMTAVLATMGELVDAPEDNVKAWVGESDDQAGAARLALAFEETSKKPRPRLRAWLTERVDHE